MISTSEIVPSEVLALFHVSLVVYGSNLPKGQGWSPMPWQLVEGKGGLDAFSDRGRQSRGLRKDLEKIDLRIEEISLFDEISNAVSAGTFELMDFAVMNFSKVQPQVQVGEPTFYPKRTPNDSEIYPVQTLEEVFNLLRSCDPLRYPVFFIHKDRRCKLFDQLPVSEPESFLVQGCCGASLA